MAKALVLHFDEIERIDRLLVATEQRRDRTMRDLERRRADLALRLQNFINQRVQATPGQKTDDGGR
jgi:hypothetical protein